MRLLTASAYFESHRGGVELVAGRLNRELAALGVEVTWIAGEASPTPVAAPGLAATPLPVWNVAERRLGVPFPIPAPWALGRILSAVRACDAVLLHDCLYLSNLLVFLAARGVGRPVAVIQHIGEVPYRNPLLRALMGLANAVVARPLLAAADQVSFISAISQRHFATVRFRRPPELVFNGVDSALFTPLAAGEDRAALRARLGLPAAARIALFVGRFVEKKGLAFLRAAAERDPQGLWLLAGWGPIDPDDWGLANVRVIRGLDHAGLADLYRAADVLALPSAGEGFPLVVQEALACGLAVVCGEETVEADPAAAPYLAGLPLDPADPARTAQAMLAAVEAVIAAPVSPVERARFAHGRYAWSAAAARHLELLRALTAERI